MSIDGIQVADRVYNDGKQYWEGVSADINGMLGGFDHLNVQDAKESKRILAKLTGEMPKSENNILRALDCGAGIGRVTKHVLSFYFDQIDLLEQNKAFLAKAKDYIGDEFSKVKHLIAHGIQQFEPIPDVYYDCIWGQWVFGHITDQDLVIFLDKCHKILNKPHGIVVIKDNITKSSTSILDQVDSSVTRSDKAFNKVFTNLANFEIKCTFEHSMPKDMFPVKTYVLKLK